MHNARKMQVGYKGRDSIKRDENVAVQDKLENVTTVSSKMLRRNLYAEVLAA